MKAIFSLIGSKAFLVRKLISILPDHERYIEPFAGGARLFFAKEPSSIEILNDKNNCLVNLYRVIQNDEKRQRLIKLLNETPYSRSVFQRWKSEGIPQDDIEKAGRYFFLCKASFAGDVLKGGFACPSRSTTRNPAQTYQNSIDALEHIAKRLKGVTIECLDYKDCISRYDSESSLTYVDCPYYGSEHYYSKDSFSQEDHYRLAELLHGIKGKAMVSHYQNSLYDELYKGWNRCEYQSFKGSHKSEGEKKPKPRTKEVLYCNFQSVRTRSLFDG